MRFWELKQLYENGTDRAQIHAAIDEMGYDAAEERDRISTLLHMAAKYADAELLKKLLEAGASVMARSEGDGQTALELAADRDNEPLVKLILMNS